MESLEKKSGIILMSGGMDSTSLLYLALNLGGKIAALSVNYGQRHSRELEAAKEICRRASVEHRILHLQSLRDLMGGSSQTSTEIEVPEGHYAEESMKKTVVPNRNMVLLSMAGAWCISKGWDYVGYAAHAGDHTIYPDCREVFVDALSKAFALCDWKPPTLQAPFADITKGQVAKIGHANNAPLHLTYSCYKGGEEHCGVCGTCCERKEAFTEAGLLDPTEYLN